MIPPGSRYEASEKIGTSAHVYSERGYPMLTGDLGMTNVHVMYDTRNTLYLMRTEPDVMGATKLYYADETENMVFLGFKFFDDCTRWNEVADLNMHVWYPLDLMPGQVMRAPV